MERDMERSKYNEFCQKTEEELKRQNLNQIQYKKMIEAEINSNLKKQIELKSNSRSSREETKIINHINALDQILQSQTGRNSDCENCHRPHPKSALTRVFK